MVDGGTLERLSTGSRELDEALHGGLPIRSMIIIAGASGTGKTALTLQTVFECARQGGKSVYFTTLSEPPSKLIRYMQLYRCFDLQLFEDHVVLADLGTTLRERGADETLGELIDRVEAEQPELVVLDSFKAIHDLIEASRERTFVYELAVAMAGWGATTVLVGEYTGSDLASLPEFAIADGIIHLASVRRELTLVRELEIVKLRGSGFASGVHFYDVDADGLTLYPRVREGDHVEGDDALRDERAATGVAGLDALLGGGLLRSSSTVLLGATGTGKTLLGLHFAIEGARHGEPTLVLTLEETPAQLRATAKGLGWDLARLEEERLVELRYTSPVELSPDRFLHESVRAVARVGARRVILDSLTTLALGSTSERRFGELVYSLMKQMRALGATIVMPMEVPEILGAVRVTGHGVSFAADNIVYMRYLEHAGWLGRAATVIKARGVAHSTDICEMHIGSGGVVVGEPLRELHGVLTGLPRRIERRSKIS